MPPWGALMWYVECADFARLAEEVMGGAGRAEPEETRFPEFREPLPSGSRH